MLSVPTQHETQKDHRIPGFRTPQHYASLRRSITLEWQNLLENFQNLSNLS